MKTVVSKGEFARRKSRGPSAVSNWIAAGKITAAALIGKGNAAKIWVEQAERDLAASLDPSQQVIQAAPILPQAPAVLPDLPLVARADEAAPAASAGLAARPAAATDREMDLARRTKADADRAELDLEAARRKMAVDEGRYVVAEDAARAWGKELARFIADTETFLSSTLARDIAATHGLDWKALSVEIRERFRAFRSETSEEARARREAPAPEAETETEQDAQG